MDERSTRHLQTAERNRGVAESLVASSDGSSVSAEWSAVAAFYSAVHLVNAYLWERLGIEPHDHLERTRFVAVAADLRECRASYQRLRSLAFQARYEPGFRLATAVAIDLIAHDLTTIQSAVLDALELG